MSYRLRGNTKHTQRDGYSPAEITVEAAVEREEDYRPGTITEGTLRVHQELVHACEELNREASATLTNHPSATKGNDQ